MTRRSCQPRTPRIALADVGLFPAHLGPDSNSSWINSRGQRQYAEARRLHTEIQHALDTAPLTLQQRNELERHAAKLAGSLAHPWFPMGWGRRLIMAGIVALGLQQARTGNYEPLLFWLLLAVFSPRIMGWCDLQIGRVHRMLSNEPW